MEVAGQDISQNTIDHWIFVAARSQAALSKRALVIVPTRPPAFPVCVRQMRHRFGGASRSARRVDCQRLFHTLSNQALDFLIRALWYDDQAAVEHITITRTEVMRAFERARRLQFGSRARFRRFLRQTGQTVKDILFRFRANLAFTALLRRTHQGTLKGFRRLDREIQRRFRPETICAPHYVIEDCGNFRRASGR